MIYITRKFLKDMQTAYVYTQLKENYYTVIKFSAQRFNDDDL